MSWKGYVSDIRKDKTGRFKYLPSVSHGQLLFMQHLISKMAHDGIGVVVHNGSSLFSGDAGNSESNNCKWMLDNDIVEALIQLPTDLCVTPLRSALTRVSRVDPADPRLSLCSPTTRITLQGSNGRAFPYFSLENGMLR